jgi:hypothetical protein
MDLKNNPSSKLGELNFMKIKIAALRHWEESNVSFRFKILMPQKKLSEKTGLSLRTIKRHYARLKAEMKAI